MSHTKRTFSGRILLTSLVGLLLAAVMTGTARAHGVLVRSEPVDGSISQVSPPEMRLWFSEPVSGEFSTVMLYDRGGQQIQVEGIRVEPDEMGLLIVTLPELADGTYSALWKVLSESDGHFSQGLMVFSVGAASGGTQPSQPVGAPPPPLPEVLLRWVNYFVLVGLIGSLTVSLLLQSSQKRMNLFDVALQAWVNLSLRKVYYLGVICLGGVFLVGLSALVWQTYTLAKSLSGEAFSFDLGRQILLISRWGQIWLLRMTLLGLYGVVFVRLHLRQPKSEGRPLAGNLPESWLWLAAILLVCAIAIAQALSGHAAGLRTNSELAVVVNALHMLAAGAWIGGTLTMARIGFPLWKKEKAEHVSLLRTWWRAFIPVAVISEGLLASTGLYIAGRQVASLDALVASSYGQVLLGKVGLMVVMGTIGLLNAPLLYPELVRPLIRRFHRYVKWQFFRLRRLPRLVLAEVVLGTLVLLTAGFITASPPPQQVEYQIPAEVPGTLSQNVDDLVITLSTKPNRPGENIFTVFAKSTRRPPLAEISRVILRFTNQDIEMGKQSVIGELVAPDRYLIGGNYLSMPGNWQIEVVVRRLGMEDSVTTFDWIVPPAYSRPTLISKARLEPYLILAAAILLSIILIVTTTIFALNRKRSRVPARKGTVSIPVEKKVVNQEVILS